MLSENTVFSFILLMLSPVYLQIFSFSHLLFFNKINNTSVIPIFLAFEDYV